MKTVFALIVLGMCGNAAADAEDVRKSVTRAMTTIGVATMVTLGVIGVAANARDDAETPQQRGPRPA